MIRMRGVRKSFGRAAVLDELELSIPAGSVYALLGPNGAGKTTAVNLLSTLVRPDHGSASVAGFDVVREPWEVRRRISLTGQSAAVDEVLSGLENLEMMGRLSGLRGDAVRTRTSELLERFDLDSAAHKPAKSYSGGMRRRLDLAISLLLPQPVVFLDEPTTGLDTRSRQALWEVIRGLADGGTTVLLTTQYLEEADELADRIGVLHRGRLVAEGTSAELKSRIGGEVVTLSDASGELLRELATDGSPGALRRALDQLEQDGIPEGSRVGLRSPSLDDVFLALTTDDQGAHDAALTRGRR